MRADDRRETGRGEVGKKRKEVLLYNRNIVSKTKIKKKKMEFISMKNRGQAPGVKGFLDEAGKPSPAPHYM